MISEPRRSQYLQAMGLTPWVSRYRLPNAAPIEQVAWLVAEKKPQPLPAERLHALLEGAEAAPASSTQVSAPVITAPKQVRRARALLESGELTAETGIPRDAEAGGKATQQVAEPASVMQTKAQEPLRFSVQIAALEGCWLVFVPGNGEPDQTAQRLLSNLFRAARVGAGGALEFHAFDWPMLEGLPVEAPLGEAQEGLRAYIEGRHRGWRPERLLLFGDLPALSSVLGLAEGHSTLLNIPAWQGPSLDELGLSAGAKRKLWPLLIEWQAAWQGAAADDDIAPAIR